MTHTSFIKLLSVLYGNVKDRALPANDFVPLGYEITYLGMLIVDLF